MDRSLDETIAERQRGSTRSYRPPPRRDPPRQERYPRDGIKKVIASVTLLVAPPNSIQSSRDDRTNLDNDWVHDRYDDEPRPKTRPRERYGGERDDNERDILEVEPPSLPAKLRVENLHYDLTEDDLYDLFTRIAPVTSVNLRYDRAGRSDGTAFVTYPNVADARTAIREFDGANAKGQPIRLSLIPLAPGARRAVVVPTGPSGRRDNPFDRVENPRSLFDRIEPPRSRRRSDSPDDYDDYDDDVDRRGPRRGGRRGPPSERRSDTTKPPPENIDRYVPGEHNGRSDSRRGGGRESGRRPGERRERGGGRGGRGGMERTDSGTRMVGGRPRKTQEELDAEMEAYWSSAQPAESAAVAPVTNGTTAAGAPADDDIDMIE